MRNSNPKTALLIVAILLLIFLAIGWFAWHSLASHSQASAGATTRVALKTGIRALPGAVVPSALNWDLNKQGHLITSIVADAEGKTWIGSEDGGLYCFDPAADPGNGWRFISPLASLDDNSIYSLAVDPKGGVWAGHLRHGVSVFNGESWKNFDSTTGPLGQRVFKIVVSPAGDVWIATELGLARYSTSHDSWSYVSRADGLPVDQASSLSFDRDGNLFVATQCDGIEMASASDDYHAWRQALAPGTLPPTQTGAGLPSNNINDILAASDGTVFVATDRGLARSIDHGQTWTFRRGADWIDKIRGLIEGEPKDWHPKNDPPPTVKEDYVIALVEDQAHRLWAGFRSKGYQCLDEKTLAVLDPGSEQQCDFVSVIAPIVNQPPLIGTRGWGLRQAFAKLDPAGPASSHPVVASSAVAFPSPAPALPEAQLAELNAKVKALNDPPPQAAFLCEDWATQGDWVGRYGRLQSSLPLFGVLDHRPRDIDFEFHVKMGPHHKDEQGLPYQYYGNMNSTIPRALYLPMMGKRVVGEWNDGGWETKKFGPNFEGPDLWIDVTMPSGVNRLTFYNFNGALIGADRRRDFVIEARKYSEPLEQTQSQPILARARVITAQNTAFRTFLLGQGRYWFRISSRYSHMAGLTAVFLDRANAMSPSSDDATTDYLFGTHYGPPTTPARSEQDSSQTKAARDLWEAMDASYAHASSVKLQMPYRMLAYRAALAGGADPQLLANWRWTLHLWTPQDRSVWEAAMAEARRNMPPATTRRATTE